MFFHPIDGEALITLYRELNNKIIREIPSEKHSILPEITGVEEAYIGVIPCREYLALISDDDGNLNRRLFYDNVRDLQGHNPVNKEIESTIHEDAQKDRFALLNNGVTVVAREAKKTGARFMLVDFQVVNGCQTSHILFFNRDKLTESVYMPIKLIVTKDNEVINQVIQGTNRQTEVKLEAFESLKPFHKRLEEYYLAAGKGPSYELYYERRSKQYDNRGLRRDQIVSLATQVKCFVAMFLYEPHSTHRYYGELLRSCQSRVFSESHSVAPYFVSGLAYAVLEKLFSDGDLPRRSRASRFQLLMLYRLQNEPREMPPLNSRQVDKYCGELTKGLADVPKAKERFSAAVALLDEVRQRFSKSREPAERTRAFTTALVEAANGISPWPGGISTMTGTVKWFSGIKWYGYISGDDGRDVRVRSLNILSET